ncbi:porin family protein [Methylobacterium sp. J-078]|uniref:outer membrane protein n=1 Tax=Methylobacterium sp. J-078 TaxID=2836657 RepID=UPI001FBBEB88|nr:porin family protein [Methylobacterium sp. J-078]MCJ2043033.1 porin family protein [Methylobacterium sp. J-078]
MKKLLTSLAAFTALTAAASAADLPRRAAPPVFVPVPVFTWTGFYAGFNAGYGFDASNDTGGPAVIVAARPIYTASPVAIGGVPVGAGAFGGRNSNEGFVGGGQIGYNYQFTPGSGVVVGIEADAQYVDFGRSRNTYTPIVGTLNPDLVAVNPNGLSGLDYFGTVRGRLGYAFDRVLFYGTGGFAYGGGGGSDFGLPNSSRNDFRTGWTAGGGIEYALPTDSFLNFFKSSAVTLKVEGLYVNLDRDNANNGVFAYSNSTGQTYRINTNYATATSGYTNRRSDEFVVVRAGVNYKFGSY